MGYKKRDAEEVEEKDEILDENLQHEVQKDTRRKSRELEKRKKEAHDERLYGGGKKSKKNRSDWD